MEPTIKDARLLRRLEIENALKDGRRQRAVVFTNKTKYTRTKKHANKIER